MSFIWNKDMKCLLCLSYTKVCYYVKAWNTKPPCNVSSCLHHSLCRSSCTATTWTASTSWSILRSCRRSSGGWCRRTTWARGRERCWTTPTTRRPTTARSPTPCQYKTWRETWRRTCPQKPWRGKNFLNCFHSVYFHFMFLHFRAPQQTFMLLVTQ